MNNRQRYANNNVTTLYNIKKLFVSGKITKERTIMLLKARTAYHDREIVRMANEWEKQNEQNINSI